MEGGEYKELFQTYLQFEAAKNKQVAQALLDTNQLTSSSHDLLMLTKYQDPEETDTLYKVYQVNIDSVLSQHYPLCYIKV